MGWFNFHLLRMLTHAKCIQVIINQNNFGIYSYDELSLTHLMRHAARSAWLYMTARWRGVWPLRVTPERRLTVSSGRQLRRRESTITSPRRAA